MKIKRLAIENFRIFQSVSIEPANGINVLFGENATGKTTVLEAVNVLSSLRSFRSAKLSELTRYHENGYRITATIENSEGREEPIGLEKQNSEIKLRADGHKISKASDLAKKLPVQIIHPDSHLLISGGPKQRRRFIDWGVFHVEHSYLHYWRRYEKALRQRNAALRAGGDWRMATAWDDVISDAAREINAIRKAYLSDLEVILPRYTESIKGAEKIEMNYQPGWDTTYPLKQTLAETRDRDQRRGFTCSGPHRADLLFKVNEQLAEKYLSRGQQKMMVFALLLAQVELFRQRSGQNCILLLDDLAAELDEKHRNRLLHLLRNMGIQIFITSVCKDAIDVTGWEEHKMFHVEHEKINEVI